MRDGWVKVRLGEVAFTRSPDGVSPPGEPYVGLEHFDSGDPTLRRWSDTADVTSATTPFEPGDVLFGKLRPYLRKVAVPHFAGRCTNESLVYHAATPELMQDFLAVVLRSDIALAHASVTTGTRMPRTSAKSMANLEFPLPPIEEQRRIVDLMKATDAVVESLREELKTLTATHLAWLASLGSRAQQEGWSSQSLAEVIRGSGTIQTGPFGSQLHRADYVEDGDVPVVMPANMADWTVNLEGIARITSARAEPLARHRLREGDIAWSRRGDVTRFAVIGEDSAGALCGTGCFLIRSEDRQQAAWLHTWLKTPGVAAYLLDAAVGGTMDNLNAGILGGITVAVPPAAAGEDLSRLGRSIEANQSRLKQEIVRVQQLRSALLSAVTSGQHEVPASYDEFIRDEGAA